MSIAAPVHIRHPEFRGLIGIATVDITPPTGIYSRTWGSALHDVAEGAHRPLIARCMVMRDSHGMELAIVTLDALIFWQEDADRLRAVVLEQLKLHPEQLVIHPSHSHSAPFLGAKYADRPGGDINARYLASMPGICVDLVTQARASLRESTLTWSYGHCSMAFNRDSIDAASGRDICGLNLHVKADDTVLVGRVTDMSGRITGTIVNYACHPVSLGGGNRLLSPDYVGAMREVVEKETGGAPCVFFHGASGDMTPRRSYESDVEAADQNGRELGYAALAALTAMFPPGQELRYVGIEESGTPLGVWRLKPKETVSTDLFAQRIHTTLRIKDMPTRREIEAKLVTATERFEIERLERALGRRDLVGDEKEGKLSFTIWRIGESFVVSTPAEPYSRFQMDLREQFPNAAVAVLNASDGCMNYLPLRSSYQRDVYQVRVALFEVDCLEHTTRQVIEIMEHQPPEVEALSA